MPCSDVSEVAFVLRCGYKPFAPCGVNLSMIEWTYELFLKGVGSGAWNINLYR